MCRHMHHMCRPIKAKQKSQGDKCKTKWDDTDGHDPHKSNMRTGFVRIKMNTDEHDPYKIDMRICMIRITMYTDSHDPYKIDMRTGIIRITLICEQEDCTSCVDTFTKCVDSYVSLVTHWWEMCRPISAMCRHIQSHSNIWNVCRPRLFWVDPESFGQPLCVDSLNKWVDSPYGISSGSQIKCTWNWFSRHSCSDLITPGLTFLLTGRWRDEAGCGATWGKRGRRRKDGKKVLLL